MIALQVFIGLVLFCFFVVFIVATGGTGLVFTGYLAILGLGIAVIIAIIKVLVAFVSDVRRGYRDG